MQVVGKGLQQLSVSLRIIIGKYGSKGILRCVIVQCQLDIAIWGPIDMDLNRECGRWKLKIWVKEDSSSMGNITGVGHTL